MAISVLTCATASAGSDERRALVDLAEPSSVRAAARLADPADGDSVLAAHLSARVLVAESAAVPIGSVSLEHRCPRCGSTTHGVPEAKALSGRWFVSISHTHGFAAAAVSAAMPVGIDAEATDAEAVWDTIREGAFSPAERDVVSRDRSAFAARSLWTKKEAIAKLRRLESGLDPAGVEVGTRGEDWVSTASGWVTALPGSRGVDLALAAPEPVPVEHVICDLRGLIDRARARRSDDSRLLLPGR